MSYVSITPEQVRPKTAGTKRVAVTYRAPTRAERQLLHAERMREKRRKQNARSIPRGYRVTANLSRNHPDFGCTPAEHARRKAERLV